MCFSRVGNSLSRLGQVAGNFVYNKAQEKFPETTQFIEETYQNSKDLSTVNSKVLKFVAQTGKRAGGAVSGAIGGIVGSIFEAFPGCLLKGDPDAATKGKAKGAGLAVALMGAASALGLYLGGVGEGDFLTYAGTTGALFALLFYKVGDNATSCLKGIGGVWGGSGLSNAAQGVAEGFKMGAEKGYAFGAGAGAFLSLLGAKIGASGAQRLMDKLSPCCTQLKPSIEAIASVALPLISSIGLDRAIPLFRTGFPGVLLASASIGVIQLLGNKVLGIDENDANPDVSTQKKSLGVKIISYLPSYLLFSHGVLGSGLAGSTIRNVIKVGEKALGLITWGGGLLPTALVSIGLSSLNFATHKMFDLAKDFPQLFVVLFIGIAGSVHYLFSDKTDPQAQAAPGAPGGAVAPAAPQQGAGNLDLITQLPADALELIKNQPRKAAALTAVAVALLAGYSFSNEIHGAAVSVLQNSLNPESRLAQLVDAKLIDFIPEEEPSGVIAAIKRLLGF